MEHFEAVFLAEAQIGAEGEAALLAGDFGPFLADQAVEEVGRCRERMRFGILMLVLMLRLNDFKWSQLVVECIAYKLVFAFWQHGLQSQKIKIKCK